jgi:predicted lactoylglutathione lyase
MEKRMATKLFVNLPVKDLPKTKDFFGKLGFQFNQQFTDDTAACMVVSEEAYVMLLTHPKFKEFAPQAIADTTKSTEVLVALSCESRNKVDEIVAKAIAAGGRKYTEPKDYGFMYGHGFQDLDGHVWEVFYMDPSSVKPL